MSVAKLIETKAFQNFIIGVIVFNGIILGLQTSTSISPVAHDWLAKLDVICLLIFVIELLLKIFVYRWSFFKSGWNIFDFIIVGISLIPASDGLSILRAFRILRVLRLVTAISSIRRVVTGMLIAIPGVGSVGALLVIVFYIAAVISTSLFGSQFPDWFGDIGRSMYTLFQVMTLESWSMGIVRPVMEVYPYAWVFFIPFIALTTFTVLNLFIGIIVDAMDSVKEQDKLDHDEDQHNIAQQISLLRQDMSVLNDRLERLQKPDRE